MKILLVDSSYPINSRNLRIITSLKVSFGEDNVKFATWLRERKNIKENDKSNYFFMMKSPLGNNILKLMKLWKFKIFLKGVIDQYKPDIIIASHWDCLLLCSLIVSDHSKLIYENLDMPSGNKIVMGVLRFIERMSLRRTSAIVFASRFFIPYYNSFKGDKILLENLIPNELNVPISHQSDSHDNLTITYNGTLRYPEIFVNFFEAVGNMENVSVKIFGFGVGTLGDKIIMAGKKYTNISFMGEYNYYEIPRIYTESDVVWAVYPADDFNVRVAISNKFHESIFYEVPGIFARNTCLGQIVHDQMIGFQVNGYSIEDIRNTILYIRDNKKKLLPQIREKINQIKNEKSLLWDNAIVELVNLIISYKRN